MLSCDLQSLMLLPRLTEGSDDGAIFSNKVFLIKVHGFFFFEVRLWTTLGEGNGTPLQYSCLENPMDGEAW